MQESSQSRKNIYTMSNKNVNNQLDKLRQQTEKHSKKELSLIW